MNNQSSSTQSNSLNRLRANAQLDGAMPSSLIFNHTKGKPHNSCISLDKPIIPVESPVEHAGDLSQSQLPNSRSPEVTSKGEDVAWALIYLSRGKCVPREDVTTSTLAGDRASVTTGSFISPITPPASSSSQTNKFTPSTESQTSFHATTDSTDDYDSDRTIDCPIYSTSDNEYEGRRDSSEYEVGEKHRQEAGQETRFDSRSSQSYVSKLLGPAGLPSSLQIHDKLKLNGADIDHKERTNSPPFSSIKFKTKRLSLIEQFIKRDESESDFAAGFPKGVPKDDAPREEWDRYLYKKVEYFKNKQAERNRYWPQLEAGLKFQRLMSEGVMPGSGEVPPMNATRKTMRSKSKKRASTKVLNRSTEGSNGRENLSGRDSDTNAQNTAHATAAKCSPTRKGEDPTISTSDEAEGKKLKRDYNSKIKTTTGEAPYKKRRRADDLDTNLGEAWDAHVDEKGGRPGRKVHRSV